MLNLKCERMSAQMLEHLRECDEMLHNVGKCWKMLGNVHVMWETQSVSTGVYTEREPGTNVA
jgi:hypothetical protein